MSTPTLSHFTPVPHSDYLIFGISAHYAAEHTDALDALAQSYGAAFVGNCFTAHRSIAMLLADFAGSLLCDAANAGLMPA